jgi:hypothetical protein
MLVKTGAEVIQEMEDLSEDEDVVHWTVSMVVESSHEDDEDAPDDHEEMMVWQDNAVRIATKAMFESKDTMDTAHQVQRSFLLLPRTMEQAEIFATVMNMVSGYMGRDTEAMQNFFEVCASSVDDMHRAADQLSRRIN